MSEAEILENLKAWHSGDPVALARLLEFDRSWIRRRVRRILPTSIRSTAESADLVQDGVLRLLRFRPEYPPASLAQFRTLVAGAVTQAVQDRIRLADAQKRVPEHRVALRNSDLDRVTQGLNPLTPPEVRAERSETRARMALALELLDPDDRKVIELRTFRGLSFPEVAEALGLQLGAATMRHQRATERLRNAYQRLFDVDPE